MAEKPCSVVLTVGHSGKGIPYGGHDEPRDNGYANHGFRQLKGNPEMLAEVPELRNDPALYELIAQISLNENGLASIGCANWEYQEGRGFRRAGYVEFAINSKIAIADARSYFPLFFKFDQMLHESGYSEPVTFKWELGGCHFFAPANCDGFTCSVWVHTAHYPTAEEAIEAWQNALDPLIHFLGGYPVQEGPPIFTGRADECG